MWSRNGIERGRAVVVAVGMGAVAISCRDFAAESQADAGAAGAPELGGAGSQKDYVAGSRSELSAGSGSGSVAGMSDRVPTVEGDSGSGNTDTGGHGSGGDSSSSEGLAGAAETTDAGAAGLGAAPGVGGRDSVDVMEPPDTGEPSFLPACESGYYFFPTSVKALAAAKTFSLNQIALFTADTASSAALSRWQTDAEPPWTSWVCGETVPRPARLAAMNLSNGQPELFQATEAGQLLVRRGYPGHWTSWLPFTSPSFGFVTDVALAEGMVPAVYVIAGGKVYARNKVDTTPYAAYGPWQLLGLERARLVTAVRTESGHDVFVATEAGELLLIQRAGDDVDATYGAWTDLGHRDETFIDLDVTHGAAGTALYGLEQSGRVILNASPETGTIWSEIRTSTAMPKLVATAATTTKANNEMFYGATSMGDVFELQKDVWIPLNP